MRVLTGTTSTPTYLDAIEDGSSGWATDVNIAGVRVRAAGVARNLIVKVASAPGSGKSITYTLQIWDGAAWVDTSVVVTLTDSATTGVSTGSASVAVDDLLRWKRTHTGSPTLSAMLITWEFHHTANNLNVHMGTSAPSVGSVHRIGVFRPGHSQAAGAANRSQLVAAAGDLTELDYTLTVAPGSGKSFTLNLVYNGTVQDGAGGTTNTTVTIADSATTGRWTGTKALAAADRVCIQITPSGSPAGTSLQTCALFAPTIDGESNLAGFPNVNLATSGTTYYIVSQDTLTTTDSSDAGVEQLAGVSDIEWRKMYLRLDATVTTGPIAFTFRKNNASTSITDSLTSGEQTGQDTSNTATTTSGDTIAMEYVATGTPGLARGPVWTIVQFASVVEPPTHIFMVGKQVNVSESYVAAFGVAERAFVVDQRNTFAVDAIHMRYNGTWVEYAEVALTNAEIKALRATPKTLVAAPGAGKKLEFVAAELYLDYGGTNVFTETTDNLAIRYNNTTGVIVSQAIETTGFIDQSADTATNALPKIDAIAAKSGCENLSLVLHNTGDGEIAGNAANNNLMRVKVAYRIWSTGW